MTDMSHRLALPFLIAGQAQKEVWHNEALMRLDYLVQPVIVAHAPSSEPASPLPGQCWITGSTPVGLWSGKAAQLACWTSQGWRFAAPFEGLTCWSIADACYWQYGVSTWAKGIISGQTVHLAGQQVLTTRQPAIPNPTGGTTVDNESRVALSSLLATLRNHGLIAA